MKKVFALMTAIMVMMLGTLTVSAAGSTTSTNVYDETGYSAVTTTTVTDANKAEVKVTLTKVTVSDETTYQMIPSGSEKVAAVDVNVPTGTVFPITVTIKAPGITANDTVVAKHLKADKTVEDLQIVDVQAGQVTVVMNSCSPVVISKVTEAGATVVKSAKTGENVSLFLLSALALAVVSVVMVSNGLKRKAN